MREFIEGDWRTRFALIGMTLLCVVGIVVLMRAAFAGLAYGLSGPDSLPFDWAIFSYSTAAMVAVMLVVLLAFAPFQYVLGRFEARIARTHGQRTGSWISSIILVSLSIAGWLYVYGPTVFAK